MLPREDLLVKSVDEEYFNVLKSLEGVVGLNVKQNKARWPKVLVYDVDRFFSKDNIPSAIADQNPTLGLNTNTAKEQIVPIFMRAPNQGIKYDGPLISPR